jgi:uncharacterized protein YkwD
MNTRFYKHTLLATFFLVTFVKVNQCCAQIDPLNLNTKLLEHEIKVLVDSTRIANKLPPLFNDSILFVASNHHANYLVSKGVLSHEETGKKAFLTPQDRANYYGAPKSYLVGENIVFASYNASVKSKGKTFITNDYKEIARCLVFLWINSKGHFKNMIHPDYQITGLAIGIDPKLNRIYACQKFAQVVYKYSFEENKSFFPYSDLTQSDVNEISTKLAQDVTYPFGLKYNKKEKCDECKESWRYHPSMSVRVSRNYFILRVEDADFVKELIKNRNDGFAIEIVPFDAFACGNPQYEIEASRRNGLKRTSGKILEPVYRKDLIKGFKKRKKIKNLSFAKYLFKADSVAFFKRFGSYKLVNFNAKYFEYKLGKVPKGLSTWWNHNLMYIHNKQICHFMYLTNYPGELDLDLIDVPYYPPVPVNNYDFKLEYFKDTVELFYDPGKTVHNGNELENLISKYQEKHITIKRIQIDGFCSVEGDAKTNEILHKERAVNILEQLKFVLNSDTIYRINSTVAWDHFYATIKNHPKWKFLFPYSQSEIINYLTNPNNDRPLDILSKERKVHIEIEGVRELSPQNAPYYINRDIKSLFFKDKNGKVRCEQTDKLQQIYEKAYYFSTVDTLTKTEFLKIKFPNFDGALTHQLEHDISFYRYHYLKDTSDRSAHAALESKIESVFKMCGAANHLTPEFHYLTACLLVEKIRQKKNNTKDNPDIQKAFDRLNLLLSWYQLDSAFEINVAKANLNIVNILCETVDPDLLFEHSDVINSSLIHIVQYYRRTDQLNPKTALKLGKLLCYFKNIPLAIDLCEDFLYDDEILKLYLPLTYTHTSFLSSEDEIEFELHFQNLLLEAKERLTQEEWCKLFYGKFGIPFQVMDNKALHTEFCDNCPKRVEDVFDEYSK